MRRVPPFVFLTITESWFIVTSRPGSASKLPSFEGNALITAGASYIVPKDAQHAIGAFPSEDGDYPAFPEREMTMEQLSDFVNKAPETEGSIIYYYKEKTRDWLANTSGSNSPQLWFQRLGSVKGIATDADIVKSEGVLQLARAHGILAKQANRAREK